MRNHLIHAYDSISDENIWSILVNHLPKLDLEMKKIME
ncbi:HepT-like ribonuclease domain-containing protein [Algoriphagus persicinus]|nr:HepT-like ribonuclease domain-containing protein [Algoriphagus sp. E1-3-M2]